MKLRSKILVMGCALAALLIAIATAGAVLAQAAGDATAGKTVFTSSGCGGCHTLADAGATGTSASNLDTGKPAFDAIVSAVTNPPSGMPASSLSDQQIQDLAAYIVAVAGQQTSGGGGTGGDTGGGGTGGGTQSTVRVTLKGWKIKLSPKEVPAGLVSFEIKNSDKRWHQFVIKRVSSTASKSARSSTTGWAGTTARASTTAKSKKKARPCRVGKSGLMGNICKIVPRHTRHIYRTLEPGKYKLFNTAPTCQWRCVRGRYRYGKGNSVTLRVTEASSTEQATGQSAGVETPAPSASLSPEAQAFVDAGCGGCHTLADAGTTSTIASSLDIGKPSYDTVVDVVTNGITNNLNKGSTQTKTNPMPFNTEDDEYGRGANLTDEQIQSMASYVSSVTGDGDGSGQPAGRQEVLRTGCGACHTLSATDGRGSKPAVDGENPDYSYSNLDLAKPSKDTVRLAVTNVTDTSQGYSALSSMPVYSNSNYPPNSLTPEEIEDVATYVTDATSGGPDGDTQSGKQDFLQRGCARCHPLADVGPLLIDHSNLDVAQPSFATVERVLRDNIGSSDSTTPKRYGLTPGMPNYSNATDGPDATTAGTNPMGEPERTGIATYLSTVTGGGDGSTQPAGRQLSLVGGCGKCHQISATGANEDPNVAASFDELTPSFSEVQWLVTDGFGDQPPVDKDYGMPMYLNNVDEATYGLDANTKLTQQEIDDIATFISTYTRS